MITLIINHKDQVALYAKLIAEEIGKATNIKSRTTRQNVTDALVCTAEKLKLYNRTPENGLVIFCGLAMVEGIGEKMIKVGIVPFKPINTSLYKCDSVFHVDDIKCLLEDNDVFGFIIIDGNGTLYGTVQGGTRLVINKFTVDLPKKHGRGGQSANRFARIRLDRRHNYLTKVAEGATAAFITNDMPNVKGLIIAGSADFKSDLEKSEMFDQRLRPVFMRLVDISYGGDAGFNQAIELTQGDLSKVKFVNEKKVIQKFMDEIAKDTGKYIYGIKDTMEAIEIKAVETLIIWENLDYCRVELRSLQGETITKVLKQSEIGPKITEDGVDYDIIDYVPLTEWFLEEYKKYVKNLEIITDKSSEGNQFVKGFGGIGGVLKYRMDPNYDDYSDNDGNKSFNDEDFI